MGIINSGTGIEKKLDVPELMKAAQEMRAYALISIFAAGSGHPGGSLSIMDITAALYLHQVRHDPKNPSWPDRDRVFFSTGHKAPALYVALGKSGYFPLDDVVTLRKLDSPFQGHPHWLKLPGVEVSSGSLGQGLGIAVGDALALRLDGRRYKVYCIMGDGEQQEGSVWEAAMSAAHHKLNNLIAIVDKNRLQIDGWVKDVMDIDPLGDKYKAFGWHVIEIDGHNMEAILNAFKEAELVREKPTLILARTTKGKGVSFMENVAGWHGTAPKDRKQLDQALENVAGKTFPREKTDQLLDQAKAFGEMKRAEVDKSLPRFSRDYWWNQGDGMKVDMEPTRAGFGKALQKMGDDPRIVTLHADISDSIKITDFEKKNPERGTRVFSVGIAEQNMMQVAAGLAREGKIPVTGTYGVFASGRPWDQLRTTVCYGNLNVKIAGAHGGISVGPDGATHQSLEEISLMSILPNMHLAVPCDSVETERATRHCVGELVGPAYLRFAREATPVVTTVETPYVFGKANVIRFKGEAERFIEAFSIQLASQHVTEQEDLTIAACGPMVPEAMRAAWILEKEYNLKVRILNFHTVRPLDKEAVMAAVMETGAILTAEEHQVGGFGNIVCGVIAQFKPFVTPVVVDMVGVDDRFGESGEPWELMKVFGLTAEHIAHRAKDLWERKKAGFSGDGKSHRMRVRDLVRD
ncbi:MAG: transketolase [Armatimonadetes bacterium]|nr:transketolase [Armatimonadota bacterium]